MFLRHNDHPVYADLSTELRDPSDWKIGSLREFEFPLDITAIAYDPVSLLLAIGTSGGAIYLYGGPGVESKLLLPDPLSVRFLQFGLPTERLVCLDEGHHLHIWDLSPLGCPKHMASIRWDPTTFMILSPSHNHIFLAMRNGELRTYDLACMRKSPYTTPNMWRLYEEQVLKSGVPLTPSQSSHQPVELVVHPRNLNLLFVAYEDGVLLLDLKERSIARAFELILPPGAPGGAGYDAEDILIHRRSSVTSIAVHPSAHFFAIGHTDGSISFWAIENPDEPLLVRTLDELDVNIADVNKLEACLDSTVAKSAVNSPSREPIFKLAWSGLSNSTDPRSGETILTVLGGLKGENVFGLTVLLLPPFNPGEPPAASLATQHGLRPFMATAMRQSLDIKNSFYYTTSAPVQDFCLTPRHSPHFNNTYDPYSILMLVEAGQDARMIEPREFPPPSFISPEKMPTPPRPQEGEQRPYKNLDDLSATPQSLPFDTSPQYISLPFASFGGSGVHSSCYSMHTVSRDRHAELVKTTEPREEKSRIQLRGGAAYIEPSHEVKLMKYQPHRVLVTSGRNLTVNFYDISGQLLQGSGNTPLEHWFPEPIDSLEIDLRNVLDIIDGERRSGELYNPPRSIYSAHLAIETLECAIALSTGELLVYHRKPNHITQAPNEFCDKELTSLEHARVEPWRRLWPYFVFRAPERGSILTFAISEIGFLATSLTDGSLFIIDMRGPTLLYRPPDSPSKQQPRHSLIIRHPDSSTQNNGITSLTWTVSRTDKDLKTRIRLIAIRTSGEMEIYTIIHSDTGFTLEGPAVLSKAIADPLPGGTFVITSKTGTLCKADRERLSATLRPGDQVGEPVVLITTGAKGVKGFANLNGERIGKADWGTKHGDVISAQIVERMSSKSLVAYTNRSSLLVYSLPHLEHVHTIPALPGPLRSISMDESGDFITFEAHPTSGFPRLVIYGTLFNFRRAYELPIIDLVAKKGMIPAQPQPVSMGPASPLGSWFNFNRMVSGQQIDELLAGSDRPAPVGRARDAVQKPAEDTNPGNTSTDSQSNLYSRLASALSERGQMLGDLEENFKVLEQGSKSMVTQAKRLASQNAAKSWFGL